MRVATRLLVGGALAAGLAVGVALAGPAAAAPARRPGRPAATPAATAADPAPTPVGSPVPSPAPGGVQLGPSLGVSTPPSPVPSGSVPGGGGHGCGLFDLTCHVEAAINGWFKTLVTAALDPVLSLLGRTVLATPALAGFGEIATLWGVAAGIANGLFVLLVIAGGITVMTHETLQTRYSVKEIAPRLVVAGIAANTSLALAGAAIGFANAFSAAFLAGGVDPGGATSVLAHLVLASLANGGIFLILLGLVTAVLGVALLCVYVVRIVVVALLIAAAPLLLACHALPATEGLARLWWRGLAACLGIQVAQSLVLAAALRVFFTPSGTSLLGLPSADGLVNLLVVCCLLWVLLRIPSWASRLAFAGTGHRGSQAIQLVKTAVVAKAIRAGMAAL
ncbi:MAG: hypothetical protein ACYDAQ_01155 [Mycobacteriales bacterium]